MSTSTQIIRASWCAIILSSGMLHPLDAQEYEAEPTPVSSVCFDFRAARFRDGIVFCSNRTKMQLSLDEVSTNFSTDMCWSRLQACNTWSSPVLFAGALTEHLNEGPAAFNNCSTYLQLRRKRLQYEAFAGTGQKRSRLFRNARNKPEPADLKS